VRSALETHSCDIISNEGIFTLQETAGKVMHKTQIDILNMENLITKTNLELNKLSEATGMPITQENGQRRYGPPVGETIIPAKGNCSCI